MKITQSEQKVMVVTTTRLAMTQEQQEEFKAKMAKLGVEVVYLFHHPNAPEKPTHTFYNVPKEG